MKKIIIAVDGYSSTGKSTVAKRVAKQLNYAYIDTGAMYRAVAYRAFEKKWVCDSGITNKEALVNDLQNIELEFRYDEALGFAPIYLNGQNIEKEIRTLAVSNLVSYVATLPEVRAKLVMEQKKIGQSRGVIMDGRDIGTVVFPDAELKIFMTASPEVRAKRRYDELILKGEKVSLSEVLKNITERDYMDTHRETSPLCKSNDAIEIDNSNLTIEDQVEKIVKMANDLIH